MDIRLNIFDENNKLIGQEHLNEKGKWLHKWTIEGKFERGCWRGWAKGEDQLNWTYKCVVDEDIEQEQANELLQRVLSLFI